MGEYVAADLPQHTALFALPAKGAVVHPDARPVEAGAPCTSLFYRGTFPGMPIDRAPGSAEKATRAGYVTLLGRPNSGKSTLLNAFIGEHLSIVTARPQTTWWRVAGIRTDETSQIVFLDTPGVMEPASLIHRALLEEARRGLNDADVVLLVLDPSRPLKDREREGLSALCSGSGLPVLPVVNKIDAATPEQVEREARWSESALQRSPARISALRGDGVPELLEATRALLPTGPFLFPEDEIATAPVRFFVSELVRETIFERFEEEIPYSVFCTVEEFHEEAERTYIQVNVFVERSSQKGILLGKGGSAIRELGRTARLKIEHFLEAPVYLDLWVKVLPRWRKKKAQLRRLGLPVPEHDGSNPRS